MPDVRPTEPRGGGRAVAVKPAARRRLRLAPEGVQGAGRRDGVFGSLLAPAEFARHGEHLGGWEKVTEVPENRPLDSFLPSALG
jgi:hypothetical protein